MSWPDCLRHSRAPRPRPAPRSMAQQRHSHCNPFAAPLAIAWRFQEGVLRGGMLWIQTPKGRLFSASRCLQPATYCNLNAIQSNKRFCHELSSLRLSTVLLMSHAPLQSTNRIQSVPTCAAYHHLSRVFLRDQTSILRLLGGSQWHCPASQAEHFPTDLLLVTLNVLTMALM